MSIWSRLTGRFGKKKDGSIEDWFREFGFQGRSATGIAITQLSALQSSAVMACVSILSEDVAKLPVHVYRKLPTGEKQVVTNHPLEKLLQRPNSWQNRFEFIEQMQAALLLRGNAYAVILRDGRGNPTMLVPINPDQVLVYEGPNGEIFYSVSRRGLHEQAILKNVPMMVPSEDMFHLRWLSTHGLVGLSRISLAREAIALSLAQQEQAALLAGNGSRPGGILQTDKKLSEDVITRLKADWAANYAGLDNTGRTAVLEEGLKWQALGMTSTDAEFLASRRFQVEDIGRLFRMPGHKLGIIDKALAATMAQADQDYMNNVVSSYVERWESKLGETFDLDEEELFVEFDISRFLRADIVARYSAYRIGIVGSFLKPQEARRAEGLPDVDGADILLQPVNMAPLGFKPAAGSAGPGSDTTGAGGDGGTGDPAAVTPLPGGDAPDDSSPTG